MNTDRLHIIRLLLFSAMLTIFNSAYSDSDAFDFQANAKMLHKHHGPVDKAYGMVNVIIDDQGKGRLDVMFSNGSHINWVKFNAEVKFIDAGGRVVREEHVYRWLESANAEGAAERKVTKSMTLNRVRSVKVDFYLTDIIESGYDEIAKIGSEQTYF